MSFKKPLAYATDIEYLYDGSIAGLYTCVYECIYKKQLPVSIYIESNAEPSLLKQKNIDTDIVKAEKVRKSIPAKISYRALELVENSFLSNLENKEFLILKFLLKSYTEGQSTLKMLGHPDVFPLFKAERYILNESHLFLGFVRFSDYNGTLISEIAPKNFVLPFMVKHFVTRFPYENFMIYDKTHKSALIYQNKKAEIIQLESIELPDTSDLEKHYRNLWKQFHKTISIEDRYNPKCRMNLMPKRYWENMTEMKEHL